MSNNSTPITTTLGEDTIEFRINFKPIFIRILSIILLCTMVIVSIISVRISWSSIHDIERASEVMDGRYISYFLPKRVMSNTISLEKALGVNLAADLNNASVEKLNESSNKNQPNKVLNKSHNIANPNSPQLNRNGDVINGIIESHRLNNTPQTIIANSQPQINKNTIPIWNNNNTAHQNTCKNNQSLIQAGAENNQMNDELNFINNTHKTKIININSKTNTKPRELHQSVHEPKPNSTHPTTSKSNQSFIQGGAPIPINSNKYTNSAIPQLLNNTNHSSVKSNSTAVNATSNQQAQANPAAAASDTNIELTNEDSDIDIHTSRMERENSIEIMEINTTKHFRMKFILFFFIIANLILLRLCSQEIKWILNNIFINKFGKLRGGSQPNQMQQNNIKCDILWADIIRCNVVQFVLLIRAHILTHYFHIIKLLELIYVMSIINRCHLLYL